MYEVSSAFETRFAFSRFATVPASASSLLPHTDAPDAALAPAPTAAFEIPGRRLADGVAVGAVDGDADGPKEDFISYKPGIVSSLFFAARY